MVELEEIPYIVRLTFDTAEGGKCELDVRSLSANEYLIESMDDDD